MKLNERAWAGQVISWIKQCINNSETIFEDATNDAGIKLDSGATKFPDILLFSNKTSGTIFNGWELKFPDTTADDNEMLLNALEKAEKIQSNSFVTWNGTEAYIWKINDANYKIESLEIIKHYPKEKEITLRNDLADNNNYQKNEKKLIARLKQILHDLEILFQNGELKEAINISSNIIESITEAAEFIIPQLKNQIIDLKNNETTFRNQFNQWKIFESATLKILSSSSKRVENVEPEQVLAKFTYYKLVGKTLFYLSLAENLSGKLAKLSLSKPTNTKTQLNTYFNEASKIDYQALFEVDFTDSINFNSTIDKYIFKLIETLTSFDFKVLPTEVIGHILENLVPKEEKQKFGQYFTSEHLSYLVTFSAVKSKDDFVFDPTSGTGTFLNSFYKTLQYFGNKNHQKLLNQIWGNDISHFPATLSVINLYKQKVNDVDNFPRVTRKDFITLQPNQIIQIPDSKNINKLNDVAIPKFNVIASNFPFIQQEDIDNEHLSNHFYNEFQQRQKAFIANNKFAINGKADYYTYCFYNSLKFLQPNGRIASITSNAWLGKNYGLQFKQFLLDNFTIEYVFRSTAEHWFKDSKVSTIFITIKQGVTTTPTKFVTVNFKLEDLFNTQHLQQFEDFYADIELCNNKQNSNWIESKQFKNVFNRKDGKVSVSIVEQANLLNSLTTEENWQTYFIAQNPLDAFKNHLINPNKTVYTTGRGTRTGQDEFHIISAEENKTLNIDKQFLLPILKSSQEVKAIQYSTKAKNYLFVCSETEKELKANYPNTYKWIKKFETQTNKTGIALKDVFKNRTPFWYTLKTEQSANIFISINPGNRLFFAYSKQPIHLNQRLVAIRTSKADVEIVTALLNSVVSLLMVELNGISRNLGALDLNADFFKNKMRMLNPTAITDKDKQKIIDKFTVLTTREIEDYKTEYSNKDRINFDTEILKAFGYDTAILPQLYKLLIETIDNRATLKFK
jgi:N-6 DNA Methylase